MKKLCCPICKSPLIYSYTKVVTYDHFIYKDKTISKTPKEHAISPDMESTPFIWCSGCKKQFDKEETKYYY